MIGNITTFIDDIASQTNILAINAALESVHAGEAGKGFMVVAQEIRDLEERASKSTKEIRQLIKEIQNDINASILDIEDTTKYVANGLEMVKETAKSAQEISFQPSSRRMPQIRWCRVLMVLILSQKNLFLTQSKQPLLLPNLVDCQGILKQLWVDLNWIRIKDQAHRKKQAIELMSIDVPFF